MFDRAEHLERWRYDALAVLEMAWRVIRNTHCGARDGDGSGVRKQFAHVAYP
jgi:hypothetical protein